MSNTNTYHTYYEYLNAVAKAAGELGYHYQQVLMFDSDIYEAFMKDKSVEDLVGEIF